jgi:preprotein translocase subunit YajC
MNYFNAILAAQNQGGGGGGFTMIIMMVAVIAIMYFVMIRPQKKQQKQIDDMRNNLQVGDEITTIGGIIGKIVSIKEETCIIETGRDGTRMRILRTAVRCVDVPANVAGYTINTDQEPAEEIVEEPEMIEESYEEAPAVEEDTKKKKKKEKK